MKCLLRVIPVALALGVLSTSPALATDKTDQSSVPAELRVAAGYKRVLQTVGRGVQIYDCANGAWKFREPKAAIFDARTGKQVAIHYVGPTWESTRDGSKVVGALDAPPARRPEPAARHPLAAAPRGE